MNECIEALIIDRHIWTVYSSGIILFIGTKLKFVGSFSDNRNFYDQIEKKIFDSL